MPNQLTDLLESIKKSRSDVIASIANLSTAEGNKKPDPDRWNIQEVIEHLVLAEREFIQFHIDRHIYQIADLKNSI